MQGLTQGMQLGQLRAHRKEQAKLREQQAKLLAKRAELEQREADARMMLGRRLLGEPQISAEGFLAAREETGTGIQPRQRPQSFEELFSTPEGQAILIQAGADPLKIAQESRLAQKPARTQAILEAALGPQGAPQGAQATPQRVTAGGAPAGVLPTQPARAFVSGGATVSDEGDVRAQIRRNEPIRAPQMVPNPTGSGGFVMETIWTDGSRTYGPIPPQIEQVQRELDDGSVVQQSIDVAQRPPDEAALFGPGAQMAPQAPPGGPGQAPGAQRPSRLAGAEQAAQVTPLAPTPAPTRRTLPSTPSQAIGPGRPSAAMGEAARGLVTKLSPRQRAAIEPIPESEAENIWLLDRENQTLRQVPFQTPRGELTPQTLKAQGLEAVRLEPAQRKQARALQVALGSLGRIRELTERIFVTNAGLVERGLQGGADAWAEILQTDERGREIVQLRAELEAMAVPFARAMGEVGTMTDRDVWRQLRRFPRIRNLLGLPDTRETAIAKVDSMERELKRQYNNVIGQRVFDIAPQGDLLIDEHTPDPGFENVQAILEEARGTEKRIGEAIGQKIDEAFRNLGEWVGIIREHVPGVKGIPE